MSIEAYSIEQLYERYAAAEKAWRASSGAGAKAPFAAYLSAKADYDRALILEARSKER